MRRALDAELPQFLLTLLEPKQTNTIRAVAVKALKAMVVGASPNCQLVKELLEGNKTWDHYQHQNHDLFLNQTTFAGYLTAGPAGQTQVLSLTAGPSSYGSGSAAHGSAPPKDAGKEGWTAADEKGSFTGGGAGRRRAGRRRAGRC